MKIDEKIGKYLKGKLTFKKTRDKLKSDKEERKEIDKEIEKINKEIERLRNIRKKFELKK
jgi:hypothetical protein